MSEVRVKTESVLVRMTAAQKRKLGAAAKRAGMTLAEYLRQMAEQSKDPEGAS